jgi:hypothetical protein
MKPIDRLSDDEFAQLVQRAIALPDTPPRLARAAIGLWPVSHHGALKSVANAAMQLVTATLSFDSWASPTVELGMRAVASDTRHLLFSATGRNIDLRIRPAYDSFALTGQVLGPDESGRVELLKQSDDGFEASDLRVTSLDALGEFRLDSVRGGIYRLTLRMGGDEIVLPPIVVGARPGYVKSAREFGSSPPKGHRT